jgi:hypothetical protein
MINPILKDRLILAAWIFGLLLFIALLWSLTQPVQGRAIQRAVNRAFILSGDTRRISAYVSRPAGKTKMLGYWFSVQDSEDLFFVFGIMHNGIFVTCGASVSADGNVGEIMPLSAHARQTFASFPASVIQMHKNRIEAGRK